MVHRVIRAEPTTVLRELDGALGAATAANRQLLLSGGFSGDNFSLTSHGYSYAPGKGWTALPDLPAVNGQGGGACGAGGFYVVGGSSASAEVPPGYSDCGAGTSVSWLSDSTSSAALDPGQSITINANVLPLGERDQSCSAKVTTLAPPG